MTVEENAKIVELAGMMEALGLKQIKQEETEEGTYITYLMPRLFMEKEIAVGELEVAAAE